jgi:hypothetical protein
MTESGEDYGFELEDDARGGDPMGARRVNPLSGVPRAVLAAFAVGALIGSLLQVIIKHYAEDDPAFGDAIRASLVTIFVGILGVAVLGQFISSRRRRRSSRVSVSSDESDISGGQS